MIWPTTKLKWAATTIAGGTPSVADPSNWADGKDGTAWVSISDMSGSSSVTSTNRRVTPEGIAEARLPIGDPGTLILSMYASLGHTAFLAVRASWNQAILGIYASPSHDPRFLKYALDAIKPTLSEIARSNTQANLNAEQVGNLAIPNPRLEEQRRIADFLDAETARVDRLVAASQRQSGLMIERLTESLRVLTTTGRRRVTQSTGVAWMPKMASDWHLMKVGRSFTTSSGTTPRSSDAAYFNGPHFWVNTADLRDGFIQQPKKTVTDTALTDYPTLKIYAPGSLVVAMYGATTGRTGILDVPACVNQACCVLTDIGPVSSEYAFFWFRAHREEILKLASGGGQPNISQDLVRGLRIPAPSRHEQDRVVAQARSLEHMTIRQQQLLLSRAELLKERRQALITAAVTGQFDVSTASGRNVTDGVTA